MRPGGKRGVDLGKEKKGKPVFCLSSTTIPSTLKGVKRACLREARLSIAFCFQSAEALQKMRIISIKLSASSSISI